MTAFLFIGGILAIGTAGACIAANVLRQALDDAADDEAHGYGGGDWPNIPRIFTKQGD